MKEKKKKEQSEHDKLVAEAKEARDKGLTYGQLQALKYMERMNGKRQKRDSE